MLIGREEECSNLKKMIQDGLKSKEPLAVYISGAPGTGKTKTTKAVLDSLKPGSFCHIFINCVSMRGKSDVEGTILSALEKRPSRISEYPEALKKLFSSSKKKIVLVMDEIDYLVSRRNELLYTAFEWPSLYNGKVIVIGIANSLDLTERLLPKLKVKGISPMSFIFQPYNTNQLISILKDHLQNQTVMEDKAVELCARKVASQTGDIRVALSIVGKVVQEMEDEEMEDAENIPTNTPHPGLATPKKNSAKSVLKVFSQVQSSPAARATLPQHSKIILAVLMKLVGTAKTKETTRTKLMVAYEKACKILNIGAAESDGRISALENLETMGIINITGAKNSTKVKFVDDYAQARAKICDHVLISTIEEIVF